MPTNFTLNSIRAVVAAAVMAAASHAAFAESVKVRLTGAQETPPVTTSATAVGKIDIDADKTVTGTIKTTGIDGTMAHIHMGAPGASGPPIVTLTKANGNTWVIPPGTTLTDEQYASFKAGNLYVNVHSAEHKPGEIRAQLKP